VAAATDFLHDRAIAEALVTVIQANLPTKWLDPGDEHWGLKVLKVGRMQDYKLEDNESWTSQCPGVLVRPRRENIMGFALGGVEQADHPMRIVHFFRRADCVDANNESIEPVLAQADRAKTLCPCLLKTAAGVPDFSLTAVTLTTTDASAAVLRGSSRVTLVSYEGDGVEFPGGAGDYFSVVIDYTVQTVTE